MIDTHCHLNTEQFQADYADVIQRAVSAGVRHIVIPAIEPKDFDSLTALTARYQGDLSLRLSCAIGIHPHHAHQATDRDIERIIEYVQSQHRADYIRAIGECGLDYYYDFAPRDIQQKIFRAQIHIAKQQHLPLIIHNRESDDDVLDMIESEQDGTLRGVLHCFSSSESVLDRALALGMMISFTGNITYKKSILASVVQRTPLSRIMIETDAPYMAPVPHRGKRNEPEFVRHIAEKIADIHGISFAEIVSITTFNAQNFFGITMP